MRKKKHEKYQNLEVIFKFLTHENYEQTNGIQLEFFYTSPMLEIRYSRLKNYVGINVIKDFNFESKN